jgi:hypothetical protein
MARHKANGSAAGLRTVEKPDDGIPISIATDGSVGEIDDDAIPTLDPAGIEPPKDEPKRDGRGRPKGSGKHQQRAKTEETQDLTGLLMSLHMMGATILATPELELDEKESSRLAKAVQRVNDEFGLPVLSPKQQALIGLGTTAISIYGSRIFAIRARLREEAKGKPVTVDHATGQVVN